MKRVISKRVTSLLVSLLLVVGLLPVSMGASAAYVIDASAIPGTVLENTYCNWTLTSDPAVTKWHIKAGSLPEGLVIQKAGANCDIKGSATKAGTYKFTVEAVQETAPDSGIYVDQGEVECTVVVLPQASFNPPVIQEIQLADTSEGSKYSVKLKSATTVKKWEWDASTVGDTDYLQMTAAGSGLTINEKTGEIFGTVKDGVVPVGDKYVVLFVAIIATNDHGTDRVVLPLQIFNGDIEIVTDATKNPADPTNDPLPDAVQGQLYSATIKSSGVASRKFELVGHTGGASNVKVTADGKLTFTPSIVGTVTVTVKVADSVAGSTFSSKQKTLSIEVLPYTTIESIALPDTRVGKAYQAPLHFDASPTSWRLVSGSLPAGLSLNGSTGIVSGKASATGNYEFTVAAKNTQSETKKKFSIQVYADNKNAPYFEARSMKVGMIGAGYIEEVVSSGITPLTWSISAGTLPVGLSLTKVNETARISGTPTKSGDYTFTLKAENTEGAFERSFTVTIKTEVPEIVTSKLADGKVGESYKQAIEYYGLTPMTWSIASGALPEGLTLDGSKGEISGKPVKAGTSKFKVRVQNVKGDDEKEITIAIHAPFTDIDGHWAIDSIDWAYEQKLVNGTTATTFEPETKLDRGMFVTILYRYAGEPAVSGKHGFEDVASGKYYEKAVTWAVENNIVNGVDATHFAPSTSISREDLAVMMYRYGKHLGTDVSGQADLSVFTDKNTIGSWADTEMAWAVHAKIIGGTSATVLSPKGSATRGQVVTIFQRFSNVVKP